GHEDLCRSDEGVDSRIAKCYLSARGNRLTYGRRPAPKGAADNSQGCKPLETEAAPRIQALKGRQRRRRCVGPSVTPSGLNARGRANSVPGVYTPGYFLPPLSGLVSVCGNWNPMRKRNPRFPLPELTGVSARYETRSCPRLSPHHLAQHVLR